MSTFTAYQNDMPLRFSLEEANGVPTKLGDGTFGIVLKVKMPTDEPGAVKLFYKHESESVKKRIKFETELRDSIQRKQQMAKGPQRDLSSLVLPFAVCKDFITSDAFRACERYFTDAGINLSGDGIVMPFFECTLKELLERGAPPGRASGNRFLETTAPPGYNILRDLDSEERERCILPILRQIAIALRSLHAFKLHHHDLKPANVLVKSEGGNVRVALGDFGFADPNMIINSMHVSLQDEALALGTRHYRSVEQKDYIDVCEADIEVTENADDTLSIVVITRDAKFFDSIIEKGDLCMFRKDSGKRAWTVDKVERKPRDPEYATRIVLDRVNAKDQDGKPTRITDDERTQVAFLKRQTHRTDLFGFGAIAFDLLTAGRSPERFYDLLRPLDKVEDDGRVVRVEEIRRAYGSFSDAPSAEPAHRALFNELRIGTTFPSQDLVGIILKCMLSKPEDSFFHARPKAEDIAAGRTDRPSSALCFEALADEIEGLVNKTNALRYLPDQANPLWRGDRKRTDTEPGPDLGFSTTLEQHRELAKTGKRTVALVRAYRFLRKLNEVVNDLIIRHADHRLFFTHLGPDHLESDGSYDEQTVAYLSEDIFWGALRSGEVIGFGNTSERTNFVPPFMRHRTRSVYCKAIENDPKVDNDSSRYRIFYRDSVPCWSGVHVGDFLRAWIPDEAIKLFRVVVVDGDVIGVQFLHEREDEIVNEQRHSELKGEVIKQIQAVDYYLGVLGIYIHQLFFVREFSDFMPICPQLWLLEEAVCLQRLNVTALAKRCAPEQVPDTATLETVLSEPAKLYVWLLMRLYRGGENANQSNTAQLRARISERIDSLGISIARALGEELPWLNAVADEQIGGLSDTIGSRGEQLESDPPSLDSLIGKMITKDCFSDAKPSSRKRFGIFPSL